MEIRYDRNTYTVTLVTNKGTIKDGDVAAYTYGVGAKLPTDVTRNNYRMAGWYDNEDCKGTPVTEITATDIGDKTFYAKWNYRSGSISTPAYAPILRETKGGTLSVNNNAPKAGDTVTIIPEPEDGKEVVGVTATDVNGNPVELIDNGDGTYNFKQPVGKVTVTVNYDDGETDNADTTCKQDNTCPMFGYSNLEPDAWYHDGVHFCIENDLMSGTGEYTFEPDATTTRAMIVTMLWRQAGKPVVNTAISFEDVASDAWYADAIRWAQANNIVSGYSDKAFGPDDIITREQLAAILYHYEQHKGGGYVGAWMFRMDYSDLAEVSEWAYEAMCWMTMNGVVNGKADKVLDPKGSATRAESATMLCRYCENSDK